ncbi:MAG: nicotinate-nucleotide adenylyltransferase [Thermoleophilaceae bacterium]|nr:nicotinate-nucleotide adenylyltransferase [Thermoleophilaceae bacterium]
MRIGLFGGAFNPPHVGHLVCAQEAHGQLDLDVVVWVPVGRAPHREIPQDPGPEARFQMCDYATAADERFGVSRIEVDRDGPSYTADTLRELSERSPDDDLVLILGGDQAAALPTWHQPDEVMRLATVAVAERADSDRARVEAALADGPEPVFFDMPRIDVSSTMVRQRAASRLPIRYLVPDKVANFIGAQSLYGASVPS